MLIFAALALLWSVFLYDDIKRVRNNPRDWAGWVFVGLAVVFIYNSVYNICMEVFH